MVNAARKYDRIVQVGTQSRSRDSIAQAIQWIREGNLGKIQYLTAFANKPRTSCGKRATPLPIPDSVDYDLWCGPAKKLPIYRDRLQYDCSFDWNTGDGESCNQGVHEVDVARWCLGESQLPTRVMSIGGRFLFNDACDVPNTQIIYYDFPIAPLLYEVHNIRRAKSTSEMPTFRGERTAVVVNCEGGYVSLFRGIAWDRHGKVVRQFIGGGDHFVNFIEAVRSGRRADLHADVEEGHISTAVCHTGNISYRLGKPASEKDQRAALQDVPIWCEMYERLVTHLEANEIDVNTATLGPWLEVDRQNECFQDNAEANKLAHGFYREPYLVPDLSA
jgi:predicted dehydrogenase